MRRDHKVRTEQFDLFEGRGTAASDTVSAPQALRPETLLDEDVLDRIPNAGISDVRLLCSLAIERELGDRAVPALDALWRRFKGFGRVRPLSEQIAVVDTLAKLSTNPAKQMLTNIITAVDFPLPLMLPALTTARAKSLKLPGAFIRSLLAHSDPEIRELAAILSECSTQNIDGLQACLVDPQPTVRRAAAIVLGNIGYTPAKEMLLEELQRNPVGEVVQALSNIADDDIIVHLGRCADAHPALAENIATELEEMGTSRSLKIAGRIRRNRADASAL